MLSKICEHVNNLNQALKMLVLVVCMFASSPLLSSDVPLAPVSPTTNDLQFAFNRMSVALESDTGSDYSAALSSIQTSLNDIYSQLYTSSGSVASHVYQIRRESAAIKTRLDSVLISMGSISNNVEWISEDINYFREVFEDWVNEWENYFTDLLNYTQAIQLDTADILATLLSSNLEVIARIPNTISVTGTVQVGGGGTGGDGLGSVKIDNWEDMPGSNIWNWVGQGGFDISMSKWTILPMAVQADFNIQQMLRKSKDDLTADFSTFENAFRTTSEMKAKLLNNINDGIFRIVHLLAEGSSAADETRSFVDSRQTDIEDKVNNAEQDLKGGFNKDFIQSTTDPLKEQVEGYRDASQNAPSFQIPSEVVFRISGGQLLGFQYETIGIELDLAEGGLSTFCEFCRSLVLFFYGMLGVLCCIVILWWICRFIMWFVSFLGNVLSS